MSFFTHLICLVTIIGSFCHPLRDAPLLEEGEIQEQELSNGMFIMRKRVPHAEAINLCESKQAQLVSMEELDEAQALVKAIKEVSKPWSNDKQELKNEFGMSRKYWIGLTDIGKDDEWTWVQDGTLLSFFGMWAYAQPEHNRKGSRNYTEHCVSLWNQRFDHPTKGGHLFNDENCNNRHYFICKKLGANSPGR